MIIGKTIYHIGLRVSPERRRRQTVQPQRLLWCLAG